MFVGHILVPREQRPNQRKGLPRGETLRRTRQLAAHLGIGLRLRERRKVGENRRSNAVAITEEPHRPPAHVRVRMLQPGTQAGVTEFAAQVQHPERLERGLVVGGHQALQVGRDFFRTGRQQ